MNRNISRQLLVLIRLAVIVSLAGYSLSNPAAAMHIETSADHQKTLSELTGDLDTPVVSNDGHRDITTDTEDSKFAQQECNDDFCAGFMLVVYHDDPSGPTVSTAREFIDERDVFGELPGLHRPPNI